ncbi:NAD(P)H oxidoreductase [Hyphomicrobium sp.]|uniref:NAD(P)H oxidoreductase n=1 Tax=Hyphomicrobium sp. TaxID=82 RepID=UPI002D7984ED|nr:NAD(P)H oxidoreductase [Hyphomicrobium sp.]HET6389239.1 NAD(P)H oxidoreductase [Hyphomicrobium sp.]
MRILLVVAHPRANSLTHAVARAFADAAKANGHEIEIADLMAESFDPVMREPDEPDPNNPKKIYSSEVQNEMARVERNEATVMVFPVWWWSMPALLKGWIDRVWNNGWAYGGSKYPHNRAWMLAVAGASAEDYKKRHYEEAVRTQLETGILGYCGIPETRVELLYGSLEEEPGPAALIETAGRLGSEF